MCALPRGPSNLQTRQGFEEDADDLTSTLETAVSAAAATVDTSQQGLTAMLDPVAHSWCPVIPLSELTIDRDGIDSGDVQSLHASVYVSLLLQPARSM